MTFSYCALAVLCDCGLCIISLQRQRSILFPDLCSGLDFAFNDDDAVKSIKKASTTTSGWDIT